MLNARTFMIGFLKRQSGRSSSAAWLVLGALLVSLTTRAAATPPAADVDSDPLLTCADLLPGSAAMNAESSLGVEVSLAEAVAFQKWVFDPATQPFWEKFAARINEYIFEREHRTDRFDPGVIDRSGDSDRVQSWMLELVDETGMELSELQLTILLSGWNLLPVPKMVQELPTTDPVRSRAAVAAMSRRDKGLIRTYLVEREWKKGKDTAGRLTIWYKRLIESNAANNAKFAGPFPCTLARARARIQAAFDQTLGEELTDAVLRAIFPALDLEFTPALTVERLQSLFALQGRSIEMWWKRRLRELLKVRKTLPDLVHQPSGVTMPALPTRAERQAAYARERSLLAALQTPADEELGSAEIAAAEEQVVEGVDWLRKAEDLVTDSAWDEEDLREMLDAHLAYPSKANRFIKWLTQNKREAPGIVSALIEVDEAESLQPLIQEQVVRKVPHRPNFFELRPLGGKTSIRLFFGISKEHGWVLAGWGRFSDHGPEMYEAACRMFRHWRRSARR